MNKQISSNKRELREQLEDTWNFIAHVYAINVNNKSEVNNAANTLIREEYEDFKVEYEYYKKLKSALEAMSNE